jgi:hypothetical protein
MLVFAALWCVLVAVARSALARIGGGPDGGVPRYDPAAAAAAGSSSSSAGATDIWGLGDKADSRIFLGTYDNPYNKARTGARSPGFEQANQIPRPKNPYSGGELATGPNYATALQAMQELPKLYATNKAGFIALQQRLYRSGFYGSTSPGNIGWGVLLPQTINAYRSAVLAATQLAASGTPVTFDELLDQKDPAAAARAQKQVQPGFVSQFSDPQTAAAIAQQAAQTALGRNLTTAEVTSFVTELHTLEQRWNSNQKTAAQSAAGGKDVATTPAPSAQALADKYVQQGHRGTEATGNRLADYAGIIEQLVGQR